MKNTCVALLLLSSLILQNACTVPTSVQTIKFYSDAEADLYIDGEKKGRLQPEVIFKTDLRKGAYIFKMVNPKNTADAVMETYRVTQTGGEVLYEVKLKAVIDRRLTGEGEEQRRQQEKEETDRKKRNTVANIPQGMVLVRGGTFSMGNSDGYDDEKPVHSVTVNGFYMSKHEVTFAEYDAFCRDTGREKPGDAGFGRGNRPVINVSWHDAVAYCEWLSRKKGHTYRLPTEAEWEYAARGGSQSKGYKYSGSNDIGAVAWFDDNSNSRTQPVGGKQANELGLYDVNGNVWEWCSDWYRAYSSGSQTNPRGASSGTWRVYRGGSWLSDPQISRVAYRFHGSPEFRFNFLGFRVVRSL